MDTIAAIATGQIPSAIGIVRISGSETARVISAVFRAKSGAETLTARKMYFGAVYAPDGSMLDEVLCVRFAAEHSYTGEESAEIHCHGSPVALEAILNACFAAGARQARPGEFTKRAFLNGKTDLTGAEAVIDLIEAETADAARNAVMQLGGALRELTDGVYESLLAMESRFYAVVDYPDEDIDDLTGEMTETTLCTAEKTLCDLLATFDRGKILRRGAMTAIIGAPNAGKSSLLNRLVGFDRAIVTPVAGTTRDTVEERAVLGGVLLRLVDTAGIRDGGDAIERLGIERSRSAVEQADLVLAAVDGNAETADEETIRLACGSGKPWILLWTKSDLPQRELPELAPENPPRAVIRFSSVTGEGTDALAAAVQTVFPHGSGGTMLTNARQADAVSRALTGVRAALDALRAGMTPDVILTEAETASAALGELTGRRAKDDMVERIFERFCVGK